MHGWTRISRLFRQHHVYKPEHSLSRYFSSQGPRKRAPKSWKDPAKRRKHHVTLSQLEHQSQLLFAQLNSGDKTMTLPEIFDIVEALTERAMYEKETPYLSRSVLEHLEERVPLTSRYYDVVLHGFAVCGKMETAKIATNILRRMLKRCHQNDSNPFPTTKTFNITMNAWAKSGHRSSGIEAERIFEVMEEWSRRVRSYKSSAFHCIPDERSTTAVLNAWVNSRHKEAPERAHAFFEKMLAMGNDTQTNVVASNIVIQSWATSGRGRAAALKAEEVLRSIEQETKDENRPDVLSYAKVLYAWAQCEKLEGAGDASKRATEILELMLSMKEIGLKVEPNVYCFTTCISSWAKCKGVPEAPLEAEKLLDKLIELYKATGEKQYCPNLRVFNATIAAWIRSQERDSLERAIRIKQRMTEFTSPDTVTHNTILSRYAQQGRGAEALEYLDMMQAEGSVPDRITNNTVLAAVAKDDSDNAAQNASDFLRKMEASDIGVDKVSYGTVLNAWSRSYDPDRVFRAEALVSTLGEKYEAGSSMLKPDVYIFSTLMKCCSSMENTDAARNAQILAISENAFNCVHRYSQPNSIVFATHLLNLKRFSDDAYYRKTRIEATFSDCIDHGLVSRKLLEVIGDEIVVPPAEMIPVSWMRNVPQYDRPYQDESSSLDGTGSTDRAVG